MIITSGHMGIYQQSKAKRNRTTHIYLISACLLVTRRNYKFSKRLVIFWDNFEILLEVFIPNTPRNHCITYTNSFILAYIRLK